MRYVYFGKTKLNHDHNGVICIGYITTKDKENSMRVVFAVSLCAPNDRFSRKRAHDIIGGRFDKNMVYTLVINKERPSYDEIVLAIANKLYDIDWEARNPRLFWVKPVLEPIVMINMPKSERVGIFAELLYNRVVNTSPPAEWVKKQLKKIENIAKEG